MAVSNKPTHFELTAVAPTSTYNAFRELWWFNNGSHPTQGNDIKLTCIEVWDGSKREVPFEGRLSNLTAGNLWIPSLTPVSDLPEGAWGLFETLGGVVSAKCQFYVRMEAGGQASHSLVSLGDWVVGGGSGASPTLPATIIGQPPTGDGDGRFPSSSVLFWSVIMDEGMFQMKQFPAVGLTGFRSTYMGEVDPVTTEANDPRPFVTPRNTSQSWNNSHSHMRLSPVDQSTICQLHNRPFYDETQGATSYTDLGPDSLSNVALDSREPAGHRFSQGYFRNVGAISEGAASNRATAGYDGSDFRFEVFGPVATDPQMVTLYPPGTALTGHTVVSEASVPLQLIPLFVAPIIPPPVRALKAIRHLFPTSNPWNLVYAREFLSFMKGLMPSLDDAANNFDAIWDDLIPATASEAAITNWERQFALQASSALTLAERRVRLAGEWASAGGQSPNYLTTTFQAHGFPIFTHEWWDTAPNGHPVAKDPRDHLLPEFGGNDVDGRLLVNLVRTSLKFGSMLAGASFALAGRPEALAGFFAGHQIGKVAYSYVGPADRHPYYLYLGGETFPDIVNIPVARQDEFETLCKKICPAQQFLVLRVRFN